MLKKIITIAFSGLLLVNLCGCFAVLVGAGAGAGTAVWLSEKMTQQFNASYDRTVLAAKGALRSLNMDITKESKQEHVTQLKSTYTNGKEVWVDIHKITDTSTKVEVRVGAVSPEKEASAKILNAIERRL